MKPMNLLTSLSLCDPLLPSLAVTAAILFQVIACTHLLYISFLCTERDVPDICILLELLWYTLWERWCIYSVNKIIIGTCTCCCGMWVNFDWYDRVSTGNQVIKEDGTTHWRIVFLTLLMPESLMSGFLLPLNLLHPRVSLISSSAISFP